MDYILNVVGIYIFLILLFSTFDTPKILLILIICIQKSCITETLYEIDF